MFCDSTETTRKRVVMRSFGLIPYHLSYDDNDRPSKFQEVTLDFKDSLMKLVPVLKRFIKFEGCIVLFQRVFPSSIFINAAAHSRGDTRERNLQVDIKVFRASHTPKWRQISQITSPSIWLKQFRQICPAIVVPVGSCCSSVGLKSNLSEQWKDKTSVIALTFVTAPISQLGFVIC